MFFYLNLKCILQMIKFLIQVIDSLIICLHWRRLTGRVDPNKDFVLQRVRKLVASKQNILISVQLHSKDVANSVVFSLDGEGRRIYDLGVSLVRNLFSPLRDDESLD